MASQPCRTRFRRHDRMPFELRSVYRRIAESTSEEEKAALKLRAQQQRRQWVHESHLRGRIRAIQCGKVLTLANKLFRIDSIEVENARTDVGQESMDDLATEVAKRWVPI